MADTLGDQQKRVLLQQLAAEGSAAKQATDEANKAYERERTSALMHMNAPSARAGGVNDIAALANRRESSTAQGQASRIADLGQRGKGYEAYLSTAQTGLDAGQAQTDKLISLQRAKLDYEDELAKREAQARAAADANDPVKQASKMRALMYLEDPYGLERPERPRTPSASDSQLANLARLKLDDDIGSRDPTEALGQVRSQPDYTVGRNHAEQAAIEGVTPEQLAAELDAVGVGKDARDVIVAEYITSRSRRAFPAFDPELVE